MLMVVEIMNCKFTAGIKEPAGRGRNLVIEAHDNPNVVGTTRPYSSLVFAANIRVTGNIAGSM